MSDTIESIKTISGPAAWYGRDLQDDDGWVELLTDTEIAELMTALAAVESAGTAMLAMTTEDFQLPLLGARLEALAQELDRGRGFWLLRGLPIDDLTERQAAFIYWGMGLHMGVPVSQNARGHLLGHVVDEGLDFKTDNGVRGYQTRLRLPYHTDSSDVVGLLCLKPAKSGGLSSVASTTSTFNEVVKRRPDLAHLWFNQWYYDRRNEERPGEKPFFTTPLAHLDDGVLSIRYVRSFLESAQRHDEVTAAHRHKRPSFLTWSMRSRTKTDTRCTWTSAQAISNSYVITQRSTREPSTRTSTNLRRSGICCDCGWRYTKPAQSPTTSAVAVTTAAAGAAESPPSLTGPNPWQAPTTSGSRVTEGPTPRHRGSDPA